MKRVILNRRWFYSKVNHQPIGETQFVVSYHYLYRIIPVLFPNYQQSDEYIQSWILNYHPDTEGALVYDMALKDHEIIEDIGRVYY